ncbi:MAG: permease-like cell division protein FtsX [Parcubacteria group bacterium]
MLLLITRTFKESIRSILRNGWLSIATVSILIMSLYIISVFFVFTSTANEMLKEIKNKANISIYFKTDTEEGFILEAKTEVEKMGEVKSVEYVSKDVALEDFKKANASEPVILESLREIGENPLLSALIIRANNSVDYQIIAENIDKANFSAEVSRVNYNKNKELINKLNSVIETIQEIGISLGLLFAAISLLITFNAVRITIYTHKQEIEIMRLVGASNMFIRLPFVFEGIIYGVVGSIVSMIFLFGSLKFVASYISLAIPTGNLMNFYIANFWMILGYQILLGSFFGIVGGLMAMRKYLKV